MGTAFNRAWNTAIDWLLPPRCAGCGSLGANWCPDCEENLRRLPVLICERCGLPKTKEIDCKACSANHYVFTAARSYAVYQGPVRKAILQLKRRRDERLGEAFAEHLSSIFAATDWSPDLIVPISLASSRQQRRGFNQAALLAKPLAARLGKPYDETMLARNRETRPQFDLPRAQRWTNVGNVFAASERVRGLSVLVVDDIMTTGATLSSAASALVGQGAVAVYGLTAARALFESPGDFG
jgi:ComF family protein